VFSSNIAMPTKNRLQFSYVTLLFVVAFSADTAFIGRLPSLLENMKIIGLEWALLYDVNLAEFDANLNTVGLITNTGRRKPGYSVLKTLREAFVY
jgi:hypothetical protein